MTDIQYSNEEELPRWLDFIDNSSFFHILYWLALYCVCERETLTQREYFAYIYLLIDWKLDSDIREVEMDRKVMQDGLTLDLNKPLNRIS